MRNPITDIPPADAYKAYQDRDLTGLSDAELFGHVADLLSRPRYKINSFILHAPLELLSRFALLSALPPAARELARIQIVAVGACYEATEGAVEELPPLTETGFEVEVFDALSSAIATGDVDTADAAGAWVGEHLSAGRFLPPALNLVLDYVGAAAHGPIFLSLLSRAGPTIERKAMGMTRNYTRQLAKESSRRLTTPRLEEFLRASAAAPVVEHLFWKGMNGKEAALRTGGSGVWGIIDEVETSGVAREAMGPAWEALTPETWEAALRGVMKAAAQAMLQDTKTHAKYGWSHCLTIPHALCVAGRFTDDKLGIVRLASIVGVGFRNTHGTVPISEELVLPDLSLPFLEALEAGPEQAAAAAYHARGEEAMIVKAVMAREASLRNDAHLVKYTLSCLDAAGMWPESEPLFHAAAAYLLAIWMQEIPAGELMKNLTVGRLST